MQISITFQTNIILFSTCLRNVDKITIFKQEKHPVKRHYVRNPGGLRNHYVAFLQNMHGMG